MTPERWQQIDKLLEAALELEPGPRAEFIERACAGEEELRREVESLLAADEQASDFIEAPPSEVAEDMLACDRAQSIISHRIGPYEVISEIGRGGMGEVYLARDTRLGRRVALKLLPAEFTRDKDRVRRFEQEVRAASALNHPNILTVYDIGQVDSIRFIATEFIEGETLRHRLEGTRMSLPEVLDIATQIASAICAAHQAGIIHRDIKPENVMVRPDGYVKVLDFGIAKLSEKRLGQVDTQASAVVKVETDPGVVMGTLSYMSPEQARGKHVDARADIFSVGVVIYEMVAGCRPFKEDTPIDVIAAILRSEPRPLSDHLPGAPAELQRAVSKALCKDREERYQSMKDLLVDLRSLREAVPTERTPAQKSSSGEYHISYKGVAVLALIFITAMAAILYFNRIDKEKSIHSLAVLPFVNVNSDPNSEYLSDGIAESIINSLSQLPNLNVKSFSAVRSYSGQEVSPRALGQTLGVQAVLTGKLIQRGDSFFISTELVNVENDNHIWGEQYDQKLSNILVVQRQIAKEITDRLRIKLTNEEQKLLTKNYTNDTEAYQLYLLGRYFWNRRNSEDIRKGIEYFEQAIAKDGNYALAYAGLADCYAVATSGLPVKERMPKVEAAAERALQIDNTLAEPHSTLGLVRYKFYWDWSGAERELKRAIELNPNYANGHAWYGEYLAYMGRFDEAFSELKEAQNLDPLSLMIKTAWATALYFARHYDQAIEEAQKVVEMDQSFLPAHARLLTFYELKGPYDKALQECLKFLSIQGAPIQTLATTKEAYAVSGWKGVIQNRIERRFKEKVVRPFDIAELYARIGEKEKAIKWLERAYAEHVDGICSLKVNPVFDNFRSDPVFTNLLNRLGLSQ